MLAIDLGTTGLKVAIVDADGVVRADAGETLPMIFTADGGVEQDPQLWWEALGRCAARALSAGPIRAGDIAMVAVTSQYNSTIAVSSDGHPLANALMWMDPRGARHHPVTHDRAALRRWVAFNPVAPSSTGVIGQIAFIRAEWPEVHAAAAAFVEPVDYLSSRLTGRVTATQNTLFPLGTVDNGRWNVTEHVAELVELAGLDARQLPMLLPFGEPRGPLTVEAAHHLGLSPSVVVMSGTVDSVTSATGTGALTIAACGLIIGTTSVVVTHVPTARHDAAHGLTTAPSPVTDSFFLVAENGIGGKALDFLVHNVIYPDDGLGAAPPDDAFERVTAAAARAPAGANGVMFFPWLIGSLAPGFDRRVRAGFVNLGLNSSRVDLARAVLEGVALNAAWLVPHVAALAGAQYDTITLGGGGASSALWGQIVADALGTSVRRLANPRSTNAHGAALLALVEAGQMRWSDVGAALAVEQVHQPDPATHARYRRLLHAFVDFHERSAPFFHSLNAPEAPP